LRQKLISNQLIFFYTKGINLMKSERGQALILIALGMVAMLGLVALALDGGMAFVERRSSQNAADNAALAAAYSMAAGGTQAEAEAAALLIANQNGFFDVTVNIPPQSGQYVGNNEYVEVVINTSTDTAFSPVVGAEEVNSSVRAVALGSPATAGKLAHGNAIVSLHPSGQHTTLFNGGAEVTATGGGVFVNSTHKNAMMFNSNITVDIPGMAIVGGYKTNANFSWLNTIQTNQTNLKIDLPPVSLTADIPNIPAAPTCSSNAPNPTTSNGVKTYSPGRYNNQITVDSGVKTRFLPGVYCLQGGLNINGNGTMEGVGSIKMVIANDLNLSGGPHIFDDLEIYTVNAGVRVQGGNALTATRLRFYATGTGDITVNAHGSLESDNAFFYFAKSDFKWNGQSVLKLGAPPQGDPFGGLLIYLPWGNTSKVNLNGGSTIRIRGTMMMPNAELTVNGGANMEALNSQIIAHEIKFNGGAPIKVVYNDSDNFAPYKPPTVEFVE
jgi:Flp pilus assembly protein TadG